MPEYTFKTLYFPATRTRSGSPAKVTISLPKEPSLPNITQEFVRYIHTLSGSELRQALGDPFLEDLEQFAQKEGRSLSNACVCKLIESYHAIVKNGSNTAKLTQGLLPFSDDDEAEDDDRVSESSGFGVTFRESRRLPIHSWYPYVEGFSANYVRDALLRFEVMPRNVYDPFGGAGTTQLAASIMQVPSFYSEVNPFMAFVAETKVNVAAWARGHLPIVKKTMHRFQSEIEESSLEKASTRIDLTSYEAVFPGRDFFAERDVRQLLAAKAIAEKVAAKEPYIRDLILLACASNVVLSSNMTRRADLRRRRQDEYKGRQVNVAALIHKSVQKMMEDLEHIPANMAPMLKVSEDGRQVSAQYAESFDLVITSPPYLNGTNYIRNTKLELWFLGFLKSESQLAEFRRQTICAGINDVSRARHQYTRFDKVEDVANQLDLVTKDRRIPIMVRHYFSDMGQVLHSSFKSLVPGGRFLLDIGDSQFYGVHVPTDELLIDVARSVGFHVEHKHLLARRYSRGKTELCQFEIVLRKPGSSQEGLSGRRAKSAIESRIEQFAKELPYKAKPYASRNWGHTLHSLCSYLGKLKPGIAHWLIQSFVPPNSRVLDPLGGVGTIPFEAAQAGHQAVTNDKSPFASVIATAKLNPPTLMEALAALEKMEKKLNNTQLDNEDYEAAQFGLNSPIVEYYHKDTLVEVLKARKVFLNEGSGDRVQIFLWASLLHVLHGNRPYALSRNSHPVTPFAPSGPTEYRSLIDRVHRRVTIALKEPLNANFRPGVGFHGDFRLLPELCKDPFDCIITSPPFMGMRFDRPNWLRMWFCGWGENNFHEDSQSFLERQQVQSMSCYGEFFGTCRCLIKAQGLLIIHIGSGSKDRGMIPALVEKANPFFTLLANIVENVQNTEKHGLKDKGRTEAHHLLFMRPR